MGVYFFQTNIHTSILVLFYALPLYISLGSFLIFLWWIVKVCERIAESFSAIYQNRILYLYTPGVKLFLSIYWVDYLKIESETSKQEGNIQTAMRRKHAC